MRAALIFIIWTWGITPVWVNIVTTALLGLSMLGSLLDGVQK